MTPMRSKSNVFKVGLVTLALLVSCASTAQVSLERLENNQVLSAFFNRFYLLTVNQVLKKEKELDKDKAACINEIMIHPAVVDGLYHDVISSLNPTEAEQVLVFASQLKRSEADYMDKNLRQVLLLAYPKSKAGQKGFDVFILKFKKVNFKKVLDNDADFYKLMADSKVCMAGFVQDKP